MSPQPQPNPPVTHVHVDHPSNGLGVAGFVLAILGLLTCGLLAPLGLLLSFFGLFKRPRGLALAGFLVSIIACIPALLIVLVFGAAVLIPVAAMLGISMFENQLIAVGASQEVLAHYQSHSVLPDQAAGDTIMDRFTSSDGFEPQYAVTGATTFEISLPGDDKQWGTADDFVKSYDVTTMSSFGSSSSTAPALPSP